MVKKELAKEPDKERTLKEMCEDDNWLANIPARTWGKMQPNEIGITFVTIKKAAVASKVVIRIGQDVLDLLNWKLGDRIRVFNHPDDLMVFRLVKSDQKKDGYKIQNESNVSVKSVAFNWRHNIPLDPMKLITVKYEIFKKSQIIFKVKRMD